MAGQPSSLSDSEYHRLWGSLQQQESHVCTRQCEFKQVFGNMFLCTSSGQAHVCDQNCNQRIFFDNHNDICRLSRKLFPRQADASMGDEGARKRSGEDRSMPGPMKRPQSAEWRDQQAQLERQAAAAAQ
ncbi:plastid-lipid-associated chloroplastic [Micractinium conductrix]|uniref:Plastid-lipid-associated chloroplastic n=1 Tax=Micractinium conductrix TaxID=554055 RepID=A0A2P6VEQ1_9CHLO|nr:plastid-lipid-associated chloroplastic [Micractinium conductrix]|eukprot:PSC72549.1 plastid-lipid-associated chloroplastic [Micractinium conductrix]